MRCGIAPLIDDFPCIVIDECNDLGFVGVLSGGFAVEPAANGVAACEANGGKKHAD